MEPGVWIALIGLFFAGGLTPGPAVMLVMSASLRHGVGPAILPALGISTANLVWIALAASGTAALATAFPAAFLGLKLAGLGFIAWLAWTMATHDPGTARAAAEKAPRRALLYARGFGLQLANPNALVFFGAILPGFFDASRPVIPQAMIIMATVTATEMLGLTVYAVAADAMNRRFRSAAFTRVFNRVAASAMLIAAVFAVWATSS